MAARAIPIIDFSGVREGAPGALARVADQIHAACIDYGFFYLANHGIPEDAIRGAVDAAASFFALPVSEKQLPTSPP